MAHWLGSYRGKRVLVTGHTGFKGSWLTAWLEQLGCEVAGFSDRVPTDPNHFEKLGLACHDLRGDVADEAAMTQAVADFRPDIVFHLAAQSLVRPSYDDPVGTYRTNVIGSLNLFEACRKAGGVKAIVSATTDKVYRNHEWDWGYREDDELGGSDPYSASKSCVELMTRSYRESFLRDGSILIASVRAGNVVGGGDWSLDRLIPDIVRSVYAGEKLVIRSPESTRPWQHVLDPLAGYLRVGARLLDGETDAASAWNFGPLARANIRVRDIIAQMQTIVPDLDVEMNPDNQGKHESGLLELDSSRAANRLGWQPIWEAELLQRTFDWYGAYYERGELLTKEQLTAYQAALTGDA